MARPPVPRKGLPHALKQLYNWLDQYTAEPGGGGGGGQAEILWREHGNALGTTGTVNEIDMVGTGIAVVRVGNKLTITVNSGGGGGLIVQDTDLTVSVTSTAELLQAIADWALYQFTDGAKYLISVEYNPTTQIEVIGLIAPNMYVFAPSAVTVNCTAFVANVFGFYKAFLLFIDCSLGGVYGQFTATTAGNTAIPLFLLNSSLDLWGGPDPLAPVFLNISGFTGAGACFLNNWTTNTVPAQGGNAIINDSAINAQSTFPSGVAIETNTTSVTLNACLGNLTLKLTAGAGANVITTQSNLGILILQGGTTLYKIQSNDNSRIALHFASQPNIQAIAAGSTIFEADGTSELNVTMGVDTSWHITNAADKFYHVFRGGRMSFGKFNNNNLGVSVNDGGSTIPDVMGFTDGCGVLKANISCNYAFGVCKHSSDAGPITPNMVECRDKQIVLDDNEPSYWLQIECSEGETVSPKYGFQSLSINPLGGVDLTALTIDLSNYTIDGREVALVFDTQGIGAVTWAGASFVGAPSAVSVGSNVMFRYNGNLNLFRRVA